MFRPIFRWCCTHWCSIVATPSTKRRFQIFSNDWKSWKAVDKFSNEVGLRKIFAATMVQTMEKQLKFQSRLVCYGPIMWSCFVLTSPDTYTPYMEELKNSSEPALVPLYLQLSSSQCVGDMVSSSSSNFDFTTKEDELFTSDLWEKPPSGFYKLNTDVTFDIAKYKGYGCGVLRDWEGREVTTFLDDFEDATVDDVTLLELRAMAQFAEAAYDHLVSKGASEIHLILEGDCFDAFVAYNKYKRLTEGKTRKPIPARFEPFCRRIHQVEVRCAQFHAVHVKRTHNALADLESKHRANKLPRGKETYDKYRQMYYRDSANAKIMNI